MRASPCAAFLLVAAALPACTALEPRAADPLPTKIGKGIVYVPASILYGVGTLFAAGFRVKGERIAAEDELGVRTSDRDYELWK